MKDKIAFFSLFDKKYTIDVNQYNKKAKDIPYCLSGFLLSYDYVLVFCTILISDGFFDDVRHPCASAFGESISIHFDDGRMDHDCIVAYPLLSLFVETSRRDVSTDDSETNQQT